MFFVQLTLTRDSMSELLDALRQREVAVFGPSTPGQTRTPNEGMEHRSGTLFSRLFVYASRISIADRAPRYIADRGAAGAAAQQQWWRRRRGSGGGEFPWRVGLLFFVSVAERVLCASWLWAIHQPQSGFLQHSSTVPATLLLL